MVRGIRDIEVSACVQHHGGGPVELRGGGLDAVAVEPEAPDACIGRDDPAGYFANAVVRRIGDVKIATRIDPDIFRLIELRVGGLAAIARETSRAVASHR